MAARPNYKWPSEWQGCIPVVPGIGIQHGDLGGPVGEITHDGKALLYGAHRIDVAAVLALLIQAPIMVVPLPRVCVATNVASRKGLQVIQGVQLADGDLVLLIGQNTGSQNGPWIAHADIDGVQQDWTRPELPYFSSQLFAVQAGTFAGKLIRRTNVGTITEDTTAQTFDELATNTADGDGCLEGPCLEVGTQNAGYGYGVNQSWIIVDGTNPPLVPVLRLIDQTDGSIKTVRVNGGVLQVV